MRRPAATMLLLALSLLAGALLAPGAGAAPLGNDGDAEWQVEQPLPPAPAGTETSEAPVSLGHIGDIEFYEPDRGALITSGNGGSVKPGVWFYDGARWMELAEQCGATDGRIAWVGPDEFWTVSDGRAGQAVASSSERAPLADNTLCRFAPGAPDAEGHQHIEIVGSYGSVPFLGTSYQAMHAAGCLSSTDCWFGGDPLPEPQIGAFMLNWNGAGLAPQPFLPEGRVVWDMVSYEGRLYESMRLHKGDRVVSEEQFPPPLRSIKAGVTGEETPFESIQPENQLQGHLLYSGTEFATALDYLRLSTADGSLWAAAGAQVPHPPENPREAGVTIVRRPAGGEWQSVLGPQPGEDEELPPPGQVAFPKEVLNSIGAEPGTSSAWVALEREANVLSHDPLERASLARISAGGEISDRLELPLPSDPHGPLGAAQHVVCPAEHDCWATTVDGWLLHLATEGERREPNVLPDPVFGQVEAGKPIAFRPPDAGVPQETPDEVPENDSGESTFTRSEELVKPPRAEPARVPVPLVSHLRTRVVHRTELVLSFHLAVKAKVRLKALRKGKVVAQTSMRTLASGNRSLKLRLNPHRWPQHLKLQTHALAPLPTQTSASPTVGAISTAFVAPARLLSTGLGG
jgi:hypothetical protein